MSGGDGNSTATVEALSAEQLRVLVRELTVQNAQLQVALQSRIAIEQAKGVLSERLRVDVATAFEIIRGAARSSRRRLHDVAAEVVTTADTPPAVLHELVRRDSGR